MIMFKHYIFVSFILLAVLSCRNSKNLTSTLNYSEKNIISIIFISRGEGIDVNSKGKLIKYLDDFNIKNNSELIPFQKNWGKEGEVTFCIDFAQLNNKQKEIFLIDLEKIIKNSSLINFEYMLKCNLK